MYRTNPGTDQNEQLEGEKAARREAELARREAKRPVAKQRQRALDSHFSPRRAGSSAARSTTKRLSETWRVWSSRSSETFAWSIWRKKGRPSVASRWPTSTRSEKSSCGGSHASIPAAFIRAMPIPGYSRPVNPSGCRRSPIELCLALPQDVDPDVVRSLKFRSFICVPLPIHGQIIGSISIARSTPGQSYGSADLALAEELARRAGLAVDHARLYRASQEANRVKDEFLATLSHELRSPLSSALLCAQMLRRGILDREKTARALETIERKISSGGAAGRRPHRHRAHQRREDLPRDEAGASRRGRRRCVGGCPPRRGGAGN